MDLWGRGGGKREKGRRDGGEFLLKSELKTKFEDKLSLTHHFLGSSYYWPNL